MRRGLYKMKVGEKGGLYLADVIALCPTGIFEPTAFLPSLLLPLSRRLPCLIKFIGGGGADLKS